MSALSTSPLISSQKGMDEKIAREDSDVVLGQHSIDEGRDLLALQDVDPALNAKMHIVNNVR